MLVSDSQKEDAVLIVSGNVIETEILNVLSGDKNKYWLRILGRIQHHKRR